MLAAPEIAWKAFVLVISLLYRRVVCPGWGWRQGEGALEQCVAAGTKKLAQAWRSSSHFLCHMSPCKPKSRSTPA